MVFFRKKSSRAESCDKECVKWIFLLEKQNYFWLFQNKSVAKLPKNIHKHAYDLQAGSDVMNRFPLVVVLRKKLSRAEKENIYSRRETQTINMK